VSLASYQLNRRTGADMMRLDKYKELVVDLVERHAPVSSPPHGATVHAPDRKSA